ncbi:Sodium/solute symporter superfamily [Sesbania bispinosa]|nr:Sodium/solute symporter superfamily [Sesbania bispinosa]
MATGGAPKGLYPNDGCYLNRVDNPNPVWNSENSLLMNFPALIVQIFIVVLVTRLIFCILKLINQPHFVAELLNALPVKGILSFETIAQLGLIYYVFITGLEMNLDIVLRARKKATSIAIAGTFIPMVLGVGIYYVVLHVYGEVSHYNTSNAYICWALAVGVTSFPVLAHILGDLKILYTGLGRVALTAATINDFYNWSLFVLLLPFAVNGRNGIYSVIGTVIFSLICFFVLRPPLRRLLTHKTDKNEWDNYQLSYVIMGIFACATVTEMLGTHSVVGALVFGLILPRGRFTEMLIEQSDDIGSGYLAPLFFASIGVRTNTSDVISHKGFTMFAAIMLLLGSTKIVSTIIATRFYEMPVRDSVALGVLMNTKGILPLIVLNVAWNRKILSQESFTIMVYSIFVMTAVVPPIINAMYKPRRTYEQNKLRTIENLKVDSEIRVMVCVHNARQASGMMKILEACSGTNVSPLRVFALQLIELKGRSTALLVARMEQPNSHQSGPEALTRSESHMQGIACNFEEFASNHEQIFVENLVAMSSYTTIHKDIYHLASEKQASLVLLPFQKQSNSEGTLEETNTSFKDINRNVMQDAPCSVGIFVDRGPETLSKTNLHILVLFIGGPDDREALSIAWRMSRHHGTQLSMVRIILCGKAAEVNKSTYNEAHGLLSAVLDSGRQKELDEEYVGSFRLKAVNNEDSITYSEMEVHTGDAINEVLNELDKGGYDLYILGQGKGRNSSLLENLLEWSDCPELGVIGDILASNSFGSSSSILVVQQYGFGGMEFKANNNNTQPSNQGRSSDDDIETLFPKKE